MPKKKRKAARPKMSRAVDALINTFDALVDGVTDLRGDEREYAIRRLKSRADWIWGVGEEYKDEANPNGNHAHAEVYYALIKSIELSNV